MRGTAVTLAHGVGIEPLSVTGSFPRTVPGCDDARKRGWPETTSAVAASAPALRWRRARPSGQGEQRAGTRFPRTPVAACDPGPALGCGRDAATARKLTHLLNRDSSTSLLGRMRMPAWGLPTLARGMLSSKR